VFCLVNFSFPIELLDLEVHPFCAPSFEGEKNLSDTFLAGDDFYAVWFDLHCSQSFSEFAADSPFNTLFVETFI
jgi:hypothetical protein